MKCLKSMLAMIVAICLMMSLAIPAFATAEDTTDTTAAATETTAAAEDTDAAEDASDPTTEDTAAVEEGAEEEHDHDHEAETEEPESGFIKVLRVIVTVLEVIASIALIGVVLLQSGKESGLSGALGGNSDSYMNKNGMGGLDKTLAKATKWVAFAWLILTLVLCLL